MLGAKSPYTGPDKWEVSMSWRYQTSNSHYVGIHKQLGRDTEQSQVINRINQPELTIRRNYTKQWSLALGIPYLMATRSSPIRDSSGVVIDRSLTQARGIGDMTVTLRRWVWNPEKHLRRSAFPSLASVLTEQIGGAVGGDPERLERYRTHLY